MYCSVVKVIIMLQIIYILLWDFEGGIGSYFFIDFVHDVITIFSPFIPFILMYFLDLFMSSSSFIYRENFFSLLILCYFTPKILESGNAQ